MPLSGNAHFITRSGSNRWKSACALTKVILNTHRWPQKVQRWTISSICMRLMMTNVCGASKASWKGGVVPSARNETKEFWSFERSEKIWTFKIWTSRSSRYRGAQPPAATGLRLKRRKIHLFWVSRWKGRWCSPVYGDESTVKPEQPQS
jgi:hypothetical protein